MQNRCHRPKLLIVNTGEAALILLPLGALVIGMIVLLVWVKRRAESRTDAVSPRDEGSDGPVSRWLDKSPLRAAVVLGLLGVALVALKVLNMVER